MLTKSLKEDLVSKFDKETLHASIYTSTITWHDPIVTPYFVGGILFSENDARRCIAGEIDPSNTNPQYIEEMREKLGYNDPIIQQYGRWIVNFMQGILVNQLFIKTSSRNYCAAYT